MKPRVIVALALAGCATTGEVRLVAVANSHGIEVTEVSARGKHEREYRLTNNTDSRLHYLHWMGQGPEPVAYCRERDGGERICSRQVFLDGDDASGYTEWVHDAYLDPHDSVTISANSGRAQQLGIRIFVPNSGDEVIVWFEVGGDRT